MFTIQARQLANLTKRDEAAVRARLPELKARYDKLSDTKVSLGGYEFKALKDELTAKQGSLRYDDDTRILDQSQPC